MSGVRKVFLNLGKGFDLLNIPYDINLPFKKIKPGDPVIMLGEGRYALEGYDRPNPVIAGIGLMTHPTEWLDLFEQYPVATYLQHSEWARDMYAGTYPKEKLGIWPAGIDTEKWSPSTQTDKNIDFLVYSKIMWNKQETADQLRSPIIEKLQQAGFTYREITYGSYQEAEYFDLLQQCKAMIFLCEHESQGFALGEALSMNVPVLAWDQGLWLDPNRFNWGENSVVPASSTPYFDARCGMRFKNLDEFNEKLDIFWKKANSGEFSPRDYMVENLTLKKSAQIMLDIINSIYE